MPSRPSTYQVLQTHLDTPFGLAWAAFRPFNSLAIAPWFTESSVDSASRRLGRASRLPRLSLDFPRLEFLPFSANAGVAETADRDRRRRGQ